MFNIRGTEQLSSTDISLAEITPSNINANRRRGSQKRGIYTRIHML